MGLYENTLDTGEIPGKNKKDDNAANTVTTVHRTRYQAWGPSPPEMLHRPGRTRCRIRRILLWSSELAGVGLLSLLDDSRSTAVRMFACGMAG